jgi:alkylhydroperoxidase family enzyme
MPAPLDDPHALLRDKALRAVLDGPGETDPSLRYAAAEGANTVPDELKTLVEKIHRHAYRVTDEEIDALQAKYGDDRMFEIIVSAALGASRNRLQAGLRALEEA